MNHSYPWIRARLIPALVLSVALLGPTAASAVVVDFFDSTAAPEAILSEMALHPASVRVGDITYLAYQGPGYDPYVAAYDESSDTWTGPVRAAVNPLVIDTHGAPSLYIDVAGRLNIIYGGHNRPLYHSRTVAPGDISAWQTLPVLDQIATYPQTFVGEDGRVVLFYRTTNYNWVMRTSDAARESFGSPETVLIGGADTWWYADFRPGSNGTIHAAFVWNDYFERLSGREFARHNVYYMRRDSDGTWRDVNDTYVPVPIDHVTADETVKVIDSGDALVNEISVKEDDTGAPCILFITGTEAGVDGFEWRYLRGDAAGWTVSNITTADHFFDSGAFLPAAGGAVEALLVVGDSGAEGAENSNYRGRGGPIERWTSTDYGVTWSRESTISPDEPATLFGDPQFVINGEGRARAVFIEWTNDETNFFNRMYLWGDSGLVTRDVEPRTERLEGPRRADTAVEVSRESFPEGSRTVLIAREDDFPDALAGVPLAHALHAPLLLASSAGVSEGTCEEIVRLGATKAIILGGTSALNMQVDGDLINKTTVTSIERLAGADRYATARKIAERHLAIDPTMPHDSAFVVSGENWPDATAAAPLAATAGVPIVLVRQNSIPADSLATLKTWQVERTVVVGGESVIGPVVYRALPSPIRVAGIDRYRTAEAAARYGLETTLLPYRAMVATGRDFPDALTGACLAARVRAPVLLTQPSTLSEGAVDYFESVNGQVIRAYIIGSVDVVDDSVESHIHSLME